MGKGSKANPSWGNRSGKGSTDRGSFKKLKVVEEWNHLPKKLLKPYADRRGTFMKTEDVAVGTYLMAENFRDVAADPGVSELVARPAMGANLMAASCEVGLEAIHKICDWDEAVGIEKCRELFEDGGVCWKGHGYQDEGVG